MKRLIASALLFILSAISLQAGIVEPPRGFQKRVWDSTLALYGTKGKETHFICTARPIQAIPGGYRLLTAGHCVQDTPVGLVFSVSDEISSQSYPVTLVKAYEGDGLDFAIFDFKTKKQYTILAFATPHDTRVGDRTVNANFTFGLGKQLSLGVIASQELLESEACDANECLGDFLVQENAGSGASGSAVISARTHKIIGILVAQAQGKTGSVGFTIEPISLLTRFLKGPNQPHPTADDEN